MATLHVRNIPEALYQRLREQAKEQNRSLSAEVLIMLDRALRKPTTDQASVLENIRRRRASYSTMDDVPDSATLLREDRGDLEARPERAGLVVDERLVAEALQLGQHHTADEAVAAALAEYVTRQRQLEIIDLMGTIEYDANYDYKAQRVRS